MAIETEEPQAVVEEEEQEGGPVKSFLDYSDPFASGLAGRMTMQELVRYSFEGLEAWARDNGCPRGEDETPLEFARRMWPRETLTTTALSTWLFPVRLGLPRATSAFC